MSVSRMKNLIILVLSICAACLLAVAVPNRLSQTHEQRRMLAELKTLYESYGLRIELDELPRSPTLYSVELSESGAQTAAQALLGQKAVQPDGGDRFESEYTSELGTLTLTRTGGFSAVLTGGDASALGDGLSCGAVLSRSLLQPDRDKASNSARMPDKILYFRFIFIFSL